MTRDYPFERDSERPAWTAVTITSAFHRTAGDVGTDGAVGAQTTGRFPSPTNAQQRTDGYERIERHDPLERLYEQGDWETEGATGLTDAQREALLTAYEEGTSRSRARPPSRRSPTC